MDINSLPSLDEIDIQLARQDFLEFIKYTWPDFKPGQEYDANWHHEAMAKALDDWAHGLIDRLMIFVPPQHGKSQQSSRHLPAFCAGLDPNRNTAICSYSDELAGGFSNDAQNIIEGELYQKVFPETKIPKKGGHSKYKRNADECQFIGKSGRIYSAGTGNPLTGKTVHNAIIDDPVKDRAAANSETERNKAWDWLVDVLFSRLNNTSRVLLLMTRWHEDDMAGRLLKLDDEREAQGLPRQWTVIRFPAIKEEGEDLPGDPREVGEALWPAMHAVENILDQKRKSEQTFNSLYQQRPSTPGGNILHTDEMAVITMPEFMEKLRGRRPVWDFLVDGAYTDKTQNDPSAIYCSTMVDGLVYVRKVVSVRKEFDDLLSFIKEFTAKHGYTRRSTIEVEPKANGLSVVQSLKRHTKLNVKKYKWPKDDEGQRMEKQDKVERVNSIAPTVNSGRVVLIEDGSNWTTNFKEQCGAFPNGTHDDEVDCLTMDIAKRFFSKRGKQRIEKEN